MGKTAYEFLASAYLCSSSEEMSGWTFVSLPKEQSDEIRGSFKYLEEGWGRMKVTAIIGDSEWQTSIWYDTKQETYLLPIKAKIRKQEKVVLDKEIKVTVLI